LGYTLSGVNSRINLLSEGSFEGKKIKDPQELADLIRPYVDCQTSAYALKVNGTEKVFLKTKEEAESLIEILKTGFLKEGEEILSYEFKEEIEIIESNASSEKIMTVADAQNYVLTGTDKIETYKVSKGDTLSTIAEKHGLGLSKLREANPEIKGDFIKIGQELKLVKLEPIVHVMVAKEVTVEEAIPYATKYTNSSELWAGQTQVKKAGENGLREVTYKVISENGKQVEKQELNAVVLKEPSAKEVLRGTQQMVASRGGGDGQLAWPLRGSITSRYGARGSGFHTGIDISGSKGTPVYSAGNGRVIFAGWSGSYGNLLIIDHGNGLTTKYAHLTAFKVSLGQSVERGDLVGTVGSTGRSTGNHLHFETNVNSRHVDPMRYLGK
jgi:murein DD-endopeptidase MepM/ murein hydrolase activator NlpD